MHHNRLRSGFFAFYAGVALLLGTLSGTLPAHAQGDDRIAFASDRDGNLEIYVMSRDGGSVQRLTHHNAQDIDPAWSPDRQQIAFASNRDGPFAVYIMNADGSNVRQVTPNDGNYYGSPAWSPDGRYLALVSDRTGNLEVHTIEASGANLHALTNNPDEDGEPSWSPDGSRIAFSSHRNGFSEIFTVDIQGGWPQQLTSGSGADNLSPAWSPDGQQIAFVANTGLYSEIYIVNADGSNERVLITVDEYFIDSPSWSPDGQAIAYQVSKPGEKATIRSIQADGNSSRQITVADHNSKWPTWFTAEGGSVAAADGTVGQWTVASRTRIAPLVVASSIDQYGCAVGRTDYFSNDDTIYIVAENSDIPQGTTLFMRLYASGRAVEDTAELTADTDYERVCVNFLFEPIEGATFDLGSYEAELYVNGSPAGSVGFAIR